MAVSPFSSCFFSLLTFPTLLEKSQWTDRGFYNECWGTYVSFHFSAVYDLEFYLPRGVSCLPAAIPAGCSLSGVN